MKDKKNINNQQNTFERVSKVCLPPVNQELMENTNCNQAKVVSIKHVSEKQKHALINQIIKTTPSF